MRIVVFSDSHNNYAVLSKIVSMESSANLFIHLGDGEKEFTLLRLTHPRRQMLGVRGNCDFASLGKTEGFLICDGKRILYTHGHLYGVKSGLGALHARALEKQADIVLFGHTHLAFSMDIDDIYLLNPGSVSSYARGGASYGVLEITESGITTQIVPI